MSTGIDMGMEIAIFLAYAAGLFLVYLFGKFLLLPLKALGKLLLNSALGGIFIVIVNLAGDIFGFGIPLNILNALIIGILGLPGAILLLIFCN